MRLRPLRDPPDGPARLFGGDDAPCAGLAGRLLGLLKSFDRRAAPLALGKIGSADAAVGLGNAANDRDAVVQRFAGEALPEVKRAA